MKKNNKKAISATIDSDLISWIDGVLSSNNIYRNKSHIIELAIQNYREQMKSRNKGKEVKI